MEIREPRNSDELAEAKALFEEYWNSFGFTPCFQNFGAELESLPGKYAPPEGRLALLYIDGRPAGCAAFRRWDGERCEAKRLYIRPEFRGRGAGRTLLRWLLAEASAAGYREIVCDTMPVMTEALAMYERAGFERTGPYAPDATPGAIYLRLKLA